MPTLFVDYSAARPLPATLRAESITGVARYISDYPAKNLTPVERDALFAVGLQIVLVWENGGADAAQGFDTGVAHATKAEAMADALGYPLTCPIFYAVDYPATLGAVDPYFKGVASVAKRPIGGYGPRLVIEDLLSRGLCRYGWQSAGWDAGGLTSQTCHLVQQVSPANPIPGTDTNVVLRSFPTWAKTAPTPPVPASKPAPAPAPTPTPTPAQKGLTVRLVDLRNANNTVVTGPNIAPMQRLLGTVADGKAGPMTRGALGAAQIRMFGKADFIFGPATAEGLLAGK